jgi:hypothetical protein
LITYFEQEALDCRMPDSEKQDGGAPAFYRTQAARCRVTASDPANMQQIRDAYLDLAKHWEQLARQASAL